MLQAKWTYGYTTAEEDRAPRRAEAREIRQIRVLRDALSFLIQSRFPLPVYMLHQRSPSKLTRTVPGNVSGQAGWGPEQPGLVEGAYGRGI